MKKSNKFIVFIIMLITSIIASCIIICLALSFKIDIFIPIIMIGIGFLTGTILLIKSEKNSIDVIVDDIITEFFMHNLN